MTTGDTGAGGSAAAAHDDAMHHHVDVHVLYVDDLKKISFKESVDKTLQQLWDKSYVELEIAKKPKDVFQTGGEHPKSLMSHLSLTLKQAHEQKVIENWHFGIASEKGGA
jgi:hypothetical protein